jgi:cation diffusion facilitator CzcD-associated flavoprotein CzcO
VVGAVKPLYHATAGSWEEPMEPIIAALQAVSRRVHEELDVFQYPAKDWVTPTRGPNGRAVQNVVIVGGGQTGLAIAFGLQRERISGVQVLDANPSGLEGPWMTHARMITLRTLKYLTGPDLGLPGLTFRAWHEAQYGKQSWQDLVRIQKDEWMRYLVWFRDTLRLPVRNNVVLERIEPHDELLALHLRAEDETEVMLTRKLVLATGIEGGGQRRIPAFVQENLPREAWAHTSDDIAFSALAGRRVAVMGGGSSAFDNAATALEHGAARVDLFIRRPELPVVNSYRALESAGFWRNFGDMPDADRWRFMCHLLSLSMPPPQDTLERTMRHANAMLHFASPITDAAARAEGIAVLTPDGWHGADFLILGTGFGVDLRLRPELADLAEHVALWGDCHAPPAGEENPVAALYPYVGPHFELMEKHPGAVPGLRNIHLFNAGSLVSMGPVAGGLNGMPYGIPRLIAGLSHDLFRKEVAALYKEFVHFDEPDTWEAVRTRGAAE